MDGIQIAVGTVQILVCQLPSSHLRLKHQNRWALIVQPREHDIRDADLAPEIRLFEEVGPTG
jgi:hypothetical protein